MRLIKSLLASLMTLSSLMPSLVQAQTLDLVPKIDLNQPAAKKQVVDLIKDDQLCHLNLASETSAYSACTATTAPALNFFQKPLGWVVIALAAGAAGAAAKGYYDANVRH